VDVVVPIKRTEEPRVTMQCAAHSLANRRMASQKTSAKCELIAAHSDRRYRAATPKGRFKEATTSVAR
jgi:hypothetical protein